MRSVIFIAIALAPIVLVVFALWLFRQEARVYILTLPEWELGPAPVDKMVRQSVVIARVRLLTVKPQAVLHPSDGYLPALVFRFSVLEYLKGAGETQITAHAYYDTDGMSRDDAMDIAIEQLLPARERRWDFRQALVFLRRFEDQLWLGWMDPASWNPVVDYSVRGSIFRAWLPAVEPPGTFALEDPEAFAAPATVSLDEIRAMVGE